MPEPIEQATPGTVVSSGALITPGGAQGPIGAQGAASTVQGPQGPQGPTGPQGPAGATPPLADATQDGLLRKVSGLTTDFVDGTNYCQPIVPQITAVRLRSWNSVANPNFEVDQRNVGATLGYGAGSVFNFQGDRWMITKSAATGAFNGQRQALLTNLPGTNYYITNSRLSLNVIATQASLAAGEYVLIRQYVEGPQLRELLGDVHSISLLASCSTALNFSVALRDAGSTRALVKACSVPGGNVPTLITLPNLPAWSGGTTWSTTPGTQGYFLEICLGAGSTWLAPAVDTWQNGNFFGAPGMDNFYSKASAIFAHFVQHEPGPLCTTPIDKPFTENHDECLRYYQKSYDYTIVPGTASNSNGASAIFHYNATSSPVVPSTFKKLMAKTQLSLRIQP